MSAPDGLYAAAGDTVRIALDWTSHGPDKAGSAGPPKPCVLCGRPAICRSPKRVVVHKVCAEAELERRGAARRESA